MDIAVLFKVVPDDQDIQVKADRTLDFSKAKPKVSEYDLNAIEEAAQLAAANPGSKVVAITVGPKSIDDSKLKKNVLARGVDELVMVADDSLDGLDAYATAAALAKAVESAGSFDVLIAGDGSADNYAQQVPVQLACAMGLPVVTAATKVEVDGASATVERTLEDAVETVRVALPAVVAVTPDAALPRIPGMKDILAAGKKPAAISAEQAPTASVTEVVSCLAPESADRKLVVLDAKADGAIAEFAAALKAAL